MTKARPERAKRVNQRKRVGGRSVLIAGKKKGYVRRFVNDVPGRIAEFEEAGWVVVSDGSRPADVRAGESHNIGSVVGKHVGNGTHAVLMEQTESFYNEDQAEKQNEVDLRAEGMMNDSNGVPLADDKAIYGDGIKMSGRPTIETMETLKQT
jgi:hypothetical protein